MTLELVLSILIGLYLLGDSVYLASVTEGEDRYCMIAKYVGASMSGLYLIFETHSGVSILFGATIALFMWPETYFRLMNYFKHHHYCIYHFLLKKIRQAPDRRSKDEAFN